MGEAAGRRARPGGDPAHPGFGVQRCPLLARQATHPEGRSEMDRKTKRFDSREEKRAVVLIPNSRRKLPSHTKVVLKCYPRVVFLFFPRRIVFEAPDTLLFVRVEERGGERPPPLWWRERAGYSNPAH